MNVPEKPLDERFREIDDRAIDCGDDICDRLMSPITKKHIEPATYNYKD